MARPEPVAIRAATDEDILAIIAIGKATGQDEDWDEVFPNYVRYLIAHGTFLVGCRSGAVTGFGGIKLVGPASAPAAMLTDLFVDPAAHGTGTGRALLSALWRDQPRRLTFSSTHSHALPLYTSFGLDAWWPLLYLSGDPRLLDMPEGWSVREAAPAEVAALELAWTGAERTGDHEMWAARPGGASVITSLDGQPVGAGSAGGVGAEYSLSHLVVDPARGADAALAVLGTLSWFDPLGQLMRVCLPGPHPAVRPLLSAGWRMSGFDLHMATDPGLIDARTLVPSPALA